MQTMETKKYLKKLMLIPLGIIAIFVLIAACGLRTWKDMLVPILGILIGEVFVFLLYLYIFRHHKNNENIDGFTEEDKKDPYL